MASTRSARPQTVRETATGAEREICCEIGHAAQPGETPMPWRSRAARAVVGFGFLAGAGALATRELPGRISLWPLALVPTWFGASHLVAAQMGYRGCPELGAIPSVLNGRRILTGCGPWERADAWLDSKLTLR